MGPRPYPPRNSSNPRPWPLSRDQVPVVARIIASTSGLCNAPPVGGGAPPVRQPRRTGIRGSGELPVDTCEDVSVHWRTDTLRLHRKGFVMQFPGSMKICTFLVLLATIPGSSMGGPQGHRLKEEAPLRRLFFFRIAMYLNRVAVRCGYRASEIPNRPGTSPWLRRWKQRER